jgi:predicted porin
MKKSLLALAVLGAFAGVASAQSSVNLYGTVDLSAKYVKNDGQSRRLSLSQDGINSSQLGFRGVEDLGGGLKANFTLISGVNADTGTVSTKFFNRRSTVSLLGGFGEVRLGRDYTPTFWNQTVFDAFGTNGVGSSRNVNQFEVGTAVRADKTIGYFLPSNIGGVYGQFMVAASEGAATNPGRYIGGRVGFAAGPFDIAASYGTQRLDLVATNPSHKTASVGASFDLSVVKLMGYYERDTESYSILDRKENRFSFSAVVPFGQSEVHAGYSYSKFNNNTGVAATSTNNKVGQLALGYVYNLSKRTAVYSTVARVNNGGTAATGANNAIAGGVGSPTRGGNSTGAEVGVRHFF